MPKLKQQWEEDMNRQLKRKITVDVLKVARLIKKWFKNRKRRG